MRAAAFAALLTIVACAPPDDLPAQLRVAPDPDTPFPQLEPLAPLLARAATPGRVTAQTGPRLSAEAAALRARTNTAGARPQAAPVLTRRARDLQARAAALRQTEVSPEAPDTPDAALP